MDGGPECESLIKEVGGGVGSGLVDWLAFKKLSRASIVPFLQ